MGPTSIAINTNYITAPCLCFKSVSNSDSNTKYTCNTIFWNSKEHFLCFWTQNNRTCNYNIGDWQKGQHIYTKNLSDYHKIFNQLILVYISDKRHHEIVTLQYIKHHKVHIRGLVSSTIEVVKMVGEGGGVAEGVKSNCSAIIIDQYWSSIDQ